MKIYGINGQELLDVEVDDNSSRYRAIMGDNTLTLYYSLPERKEIPVGAYCDFGGERYTLIRPQNIKMQHTRHYDYTLTLESEQAALKLRKFRNNVDGRLKFSLTAKPLEHLTVLVDSLNRSDIAMGWVANTTCVQVPEKCINYDHVSCYDALNQMAEAFNTEWEINGKTISLRKVEYNKDNAPELAYGKGKGFKSGVSRSNYHETLPVGTLFVQGGTDNIDFSTYGSRELHLPGNGIIGYDGSKFDNEQGYNANEARRYIADAEGVSVRRLSPANTLPLLAEESLDCSTIYPKRIGHVTDFKLINEKKNFYDLYDATIPSDLDYSKCLIKGEKMTIIFQSGMLAGKEFEVNYHHEERKFEIIPQEIDGQIMPNETFKPKHNSNAAYSDTYAVFHCMLPGAYIREDTQKEGAEWDMMREAVRWLYDHENEAYTFKGALDGIWAKKNWENIGGRLVLGGYIKFNDPNFNDKDVLIRIVGIKDFVNNPHSPEIELSNEVISASFSTTMQDIIANEVTVEENKRKAEQFTKRRFRDALETMEMLRDSLLNFSEGITPITVQTMQMLVGDKSLQFRFVDSVEDPAPVGVDFIWNSNTKTFSASGGILQHMTLGINNISAAHKDTDYSFWNIGTFASGTLDDGTAKYWFYAKVSRNSEEGEFILSKIPHKMTDPEFPRHYLLLVGVLNSEYDGDRSFAPLYGFTEILPGQIRTEQIVSAVGDSYFDMRNNRMKLGDVNGKGGAALSFNENGDGKLRLKGTLVQSQSGDESTLGCYRGVYDSNTVYYQGDEVTYTIAGVTSTYRYINANPSKGHSPNETTYWQVIAQGSKGDPGADGRPGADGKSPALVFRGEYGRNRTYIGNEYRVDAVEYGDAYYVTTPATGQIIGVPPTNESKWKPFGGSFESIATGLLLAENANIANFIFANQRMESQGFTETPDGTRVPNIILDGKNNIASFANGKVYFDRDIAKVGWLTIVGDDIVGYNANGEERLRITNGDSPAISSLQHTGVLQSEYSSEYEDVVFTENYAENVPTIEATRQGEVLIDRDTGEVVRNDTTITAEIGFTVTKSNTQVKFQFDAYASGAQITGEHNIISVYNSSGSVVHSSISQSTEVSLSVGTYRLRFGTTFAIKGDWRGALDLRFGYPAFKYFDQKVHISSEGILVTCNGNYSRMLNSLFQAKIGNVMLQVADNGIKKQIDGQWSDL